MPELTLSPQSGSMNLATGLIFSDSWARSAIVKTICVATTSRAVSVKNIVVAQEMLLCKRLEQQNRRVPQELLMQIRLVWRKWYIVVEINPTFGNRGNSTLLNLTQQQGEVSPAATQRTEQ
jgi:hypothetical protein